MAVYRPWEPPEAVEETKRKVLGLLPPIPQPLGKDLENLNLDEAITLKIK
jgi:hypothetical protein